VRKKKSTPEKKYKKYNFLFYLQNIPNQLMKYLILNIFYLTNMKKFLTEKIFQGKILLKKKTRILGELPT
jgi:hypothetical protein